MTYNLFELMMPKIDFDKAKPIKLFEAFAGIGTQAMALKKLGIEIDHIGISEIDKYALMSYEAIHGKVKNYGDITKITGGLPEIDIFTFSFPCQDLSKSGKKAGLGKDTRSGLVWEVTRIIKETKVKPKVLLMENVTDLVGKKFIRGFNEFQNMLGELGYTNWTCVVNALDCNVAQNRARIFMVSTLGNYAYSFPFKLEKTKVLKDYLEDKVDKRYYISEKLLMVFLDTKDRNGYIRATRFTPQDKDSDYAFTITTRAGQRTSDNFIIESNIKKMSQETINIIKNQIKGIELPYKTLEMVGRLERQEISIRRLTELECWRLMGISDEDFNKAKASGVSNAQLYKQAGNAIVVDVLYYIFKNMFKEEL